MNRGRELQCSRDISEKSINVSEKQKMRHCPEPLPPSLPHTPRIEGPNSFRNQTLTAGVNNTGVYK